ncbi:MAG: DUF1345 domain-containing protein [Caldimonas sp.]
MNRPRFASALPLADHLLAHLRLLLCTLVGVLVAVLWPDVSTVLARALLGWNTLVWLYLAWVAVALYFADKGHIKRLALAQAESAPIALAFVIVASIISLVAVVLEIKAAKATGSHAMVSHLVFVFTTVIGSWLLLPLLFSLSYAAAYYGPEPDRGLEFPGAAGKYEPDHVDFLYFSFTIAVTAQTSDVAVTTRAMRRLVILHSVLSFAFNTTILAFAVNTAAGLF